MSRQSRILAIDQGTTSSRAVVFEGDGTVMSVAQREFPQLFPRAGWVEHDPEAIWETTLATARQAIGETGEIAAIGITNQRETTVVWDRVTGQPVYNAIVWQDRRTADVTSVLATDKELSRRVVEKTGLLLDPYFSATKIAWILDHVDGARERAERGELAFGTIDCFLLWRLSGGRVHATDATNASRTLLYDIGRGGWDDELLEVFGVPLAILPEVRDSAGDFGVTSRELLGVELPITGVAGDQQAALVGQACFDVGSAKSTYGTGCFVVANTGSTIVRSGKRLISTIAYQLGGERCYALEGSIFIAGAAVQWLRDSMGLIASSGETERLARSLPDNEGVYLVPAFTGLGAPHWAPEARAAVFGMTRNTRTAHFARAALEAVAFQTADLIDAMRDDGLALDELRVDGGMAANDWLMAFLAGVLDVPVVRPRVTETTALGAAYLAGLGAGIFDGLDEIREQWDVDTRFPAEMPDSERFPLLDGWRRAVEAVLGY